MVNRPLVSVVDDDESVRESLPDLLRELGFAAEAFASAEEFLASDRVGQTRCLILDVAMPGMSGPDLQRELTARRQAIPIIFITAQGERATRPRLLEQGAVECLLKLPFDIKAALAFPLLPDELSPPARRRRPLTRGGILAFSAERSKATCRPGGSGARQEREGAPGPIGIK